MRCSRSPGGRAVRCRAAASWLRAAAAAGLAGAALGAGADALGLLSACTVHTANNSAANVPAK